MSLPSTTSTGPPASMSNRPPVPPNSMVPRVSMPCAVAMAIRPPSLSEVIRPVWSSIRLAPPA